MAYANPDFYKGQRNDELGFLELVRPQRKEIMRMIVDYCIIQTCNESGIKPPRLDTDEDQELNLSPKSLLEFNDKLNAIIDNTLRAHPATRLLFVSNATPQQEHILYPTGEEHWRETTH